MQAPVQKIQTAEDYGMVTPIAEAPGRVTPMISQTLETPSQRISDDDSDSLDRRSDDNLDNSRKWNVGVLIQEF